jgi:two-component system response regulator FixJ
MAELVIVDDHDGARDSLRALLESEGHRVRDYACAPAFLAEWPACDCILTDVRMPEMSGLELQEQVKTRLGVPVIILTGHGDVALAVAAMRAGAFDFIEKPYDGAALLQSLARALAGTRRADPAAAHAAARRIAALTQRERQVLEQLVAGQSNKLAAHALGISPRTVEIHRARVMEKMQARGLSDLVRAVQAAGL